jgi:hypothetical protein
MEQISEQSPKKEKSAPINFKEVKEGDPAFETAISVSTSPEDSEDQVEAKLMLMLAAKHWYLQDKWCDKTVQEQIVITVGTVSLEIFNFGESLEAWQLEQIQTAIRDYSQLRNKKVFETVKGILIDNEQPLNPHTGKELNGWAGKDGAIKLYPAALRAVPHRVAGVSNLEGTVIHELSHNLGTDFENRWRKEFGWESVETPEQLPGGAYRYERNKESERCITDYAQVNAAEDVCESMVGALRNPDMLDPARLNRIKEELLPQETQEVNVSSVKKDPSVLGLPQIEQPVKYKKVSRPRIVFNPA